MHQNIEISKNHKLLLELFDLVNQTQIFLTWCFISFIKSARKIYTCSERLDWKCSLIIALAFWLSETSEKVLIRTFIWIFQLNFPTSYRFDFFLQVTIKNYTLGKGYWLKKNPDPCIRFFENAKFHKVLLIVLNWCIRTHFLSECRFDCFA